MPTTFANSINSNPIYAERAEKDAAGNTFSTTYATKSEVPTIGTIDLTPQPDPTPTPEPSGNWTTCTLCGGTGIDMGNDETCSNCGGTGLVCASCGGSGVMSTDEYETCGECGGTGVVDYGEGDETCPTCCGTGTVPIEETCSSCEGVGHPTT